MVSVTGESPAAVRVLSFHARYACRDSGACCTARWDIPLTPADQQRLGTALDEGSLTTVPNLLRRPWLSTAGLPDDGTAVLDQAPDGACVFFDGAERRHCRVQSAKGHKWLPLACQQFPRVTLLDDRGAHVTLSHFCPTVASLLVASSGPVDVVDAPGSLLTSPLAPGLDARGQWPPLLRPGVLASHDAWTRWERFVVGCLGNGDRPLASLSRVATAAERLRAWQPADGRLDEAAARLLAETDHMASPADAPPPTAQALEAEYRLAWSAVPHALAERHARHRFVPTSRAHALALRVLECQSRAIGRYLAARAFASWTAYQGRGLRTHLASLRTALCVLLVAAGDEFAARAGLSADEVVTRAARHADWLLVHLAEAATLSAAWSGTEFT